MLDLFSRFVVAWLVSRKENSALAQLLMEQAMTRYGITPGQLTVHPDTASDLYRLTPRLWAQHFADDPLPSDLQSLPG